MMEKLKKINVKNKKVLIRVDYNIPIEDGKIKNLFRLRASIPTIKYCLDNHAAVILMSHMGRPNKKDSKYSLECIVPYLEELFNVFVHFSNDCISAGSISTSKKMLPKEIHLLENLRFYKEEIENNEVFCQKLSNHADIYVNDAFGTAHRSHASNSTILKYFKIKCIGLLMEKEFNFLSNDKLFNNSTLIVGGAKISTKIKLIYNFINKASYILIGGAMTFTFLKTKGINVGLSLYEEDMLDEATKILKYAKESRTKILLPVDVVCSTSFEENDNFYVRDVNNIKNNEMGLDIGPETCMNYCIIISNASNIIWNGPLGMFEKNNYATGTESVCQEIKNRSISNKCVSVIGGGDTVRAVEHFTNIDSFTHVSTGGGSSLKLLSGEKLNFIDSLEKYG